MKDEERKRIIEILASGEMLSSEWASVVFPNQRRECELVYDGKAREEDILAETMSVPLQQTRLFSKHVPRYRPGASSASPPASNKQENGSGWHNKLIFGDNLQVTKSLLEMKQSGELCNADGTPGIRLVYIDPPFSTKKEMQGTGGAPAYQDKLAAGEFLEFLRKRLILIRELLSDDGSIYVHLDWRMDAYARVLMDDVFGKENFVNEIIWHYRRWSAYSVGVKKRKDESADSAFIKIETFKSEARIPEASKIDSNRETLSMLMLDYDYDSAKGVFEFDEIFYADTLSKDNWTAFFQRENPSENVMAIFIDIYGNEARELIRATDFKKGKSVIKSKKSSAGETRK